MKAVCLAASAAILMAGCTTTFDQGIRDNIGRGCAAWSGAYAIFQTAASAGQIPLNVISRVETANVGVAEICAHRADIVDVYTAAQAVANAYVVVVKALREARISEE